MAKNGEDLTRKDAICCLVRQLGVAESCIESRISPATPDDQRIALYVAAADEFARSAERMRKHAEATTGEEPHPQSAKGIVRSITSWHGGRSRDH